MDFSTNKTSIEVIKEGSFGGTYFRDIYSRVNDKFYKNSWKEFKELKNIDKKYHSSDYFDASLNKYGVTFGTSLRFWKKKDGLMGLILMDGFNGILDIVWEEEVKMMKNRLKDGKGL